MSCLTFNCHEVVFSILSFGTRGASWRHVCKYFEAGYWKADRNIRRYFETYSQENDLPVPKFFVLKCTSAFHDYPYLFFVCRLPKSARPPIMFPLAFNNLNDGEMLACFRTACIHGNLDLCEQMYGLLSSEKIKGDAETILGEVCRKGYLEIIKYLHKTIGYSFNEFRRANNYAVREVAKSGHVGTMEYLIREVGLTVKDMTSNNGEVIRRACEMGHLELLQCIHASGCSIEDYRAYNYFPLTIAIQNGYLEIVKFLVEQVPLSDVEIRANINGKQLCREDRMSITEHLHEKMTLTKLELTVQAIALCATSGHARLLVTQFLYSQIGYSKEELLSAFSNKRNNKQVLEYLQSLSTEKNSIGGTEVSQ